MLGGMPSPDEPVERLGFGEDVLAGGDVDRTDLVVDGEPGACIAGRGGDVTGGVCVEGAAALGVLSFGSVDSDFLLSDFLLLTEPKASSKARAWFPPPPNASSNEIPRSLPCG